MAINIEKKRERNRRSAKRFREKNKEKVREIQKKYRTDPINKEKISKQKKYITRNIKKR